MVSPTVKSSSFGLKRSKKPPSRLHPNLLEMTWSFRKNGCPNKNRWPIWNCEDGFMEPEKIPWRLLFRCYKDTPCSHPFSMSTPGCETTSQKPTFTPPKMEEQTTKNGTHISTTIGWWYILEKSTPWTKHTCKFCCLHGKNRSIFVFPK